jgi:hypothetical protein
VNILGWDDIHDSQQTKRIRIVNNLFMDIGGDWGFGRLFSIANGTADLVIDHNTALQTETPVFGGDTKPHTGFVFTNNIVPHNEYGFIGSNVSPGRPTIERYFPDATIRRNAIVGGEASRLPPDNFFPATLAAVGFAGADQGKLPALAGEWRCAARAQTDAILALTSMRSRARSETWRLPARAGLAGRSRRRDVLERLRRRCVHVRRLSRDAVDPFARAPSARTGADDGR